MKNEAAPGLWVRQGYHFSLLAVLLAFTGFIWHKIGQPFPIIFWLSIAIPVTHQIYVWFTWRMELNAKAVSNSIGFKLYLSLFFLLLVLRPISILILSWVDSESLELNLMPRIILTIILLIPAIYTLYSVRKYFDFIRAAGGDHFDLKYRNLPFVKKGMFKYSKNSMYVFGFLIFWGIAVAFASKAALLSSAFCHVYIWIHYFTTEKPDMDFLYQESVLTSH